MPTPDQARAELARRELQRRGVPMGEKPSFLSQLGNISQGYGKTQMGSPSQLLQSIPPLLSKGAGKVGQFATEQLSQGRNPVDPYTAATVGTAISMGPDIMMAGINPMSEAPNEIPEAAIPFQRRAYGFQKSLLKTPFARGKAAMAAKTGLEQGITSATGNPEVMMNKANALAGRVGQKIGDIRESVGPQPIDQFVNALDQYKAGRLRGATGGKWDAISNKIEEAKNTILGLLGKNQEPGRTNIIKGETIPGEPSLPGEVLPGITEEEGVRDVMTGKINPGFKHQIVIAPKSGTESFTPKTIVQSGGKKLDPIMGVYGPPDKIGLKRIAEAKNQIGNIVNWFTENVGQAEAKKITGVIEKATENAIASSGGDIKTYKALKPIYGAIKTIQKGLNNEIAGQQGNMAVSLPSQIMAGAGAAATGSIPKALEAMGVMELLRRRGAGMSASELVGAANLGKNFGGGAANLTSNALKKYRDLRKYLENSPPQ